jgi:hypothetical protein
MVVAEEEEGDEDGAEDNWPDEEARRRLWVERRKNVLALLIQFKGELERIRKSS